MQVTIAPEMPDSTDAMSLIDELEAYLSPLYPKETQYGYSPDQLIKENVAFFILRYDGKPAGCCAVKFYEKEYGELKRMYVRPQYRGKGFGKLMMKFLEEYSLKHGVHVLRLETGTLQPEAKGLYERFGYRKITAFGSYMNSPFNLFYEKSI